MWDGKKTVRAQKIFYDAMDQVTKKLKDVPPLEIFEARSTTSSRTSEVRSKRRRRRQLPGADAGQQAPSAVAWRSAGSSTPAASRSGRPMATAWPTSCWPPSEAKARPSTPANKPTAWPTPTRPSPTSRGSSGVAINQIHRRKWPAAMPATCFARRTREPTRARRDREFRRCGAAFSSSS